MYETCLHKLNIRCFISTFFTWLAAKVKTWPCTNVPVEKAITNQHGAKRFTIHAPSTVGRSDKNIVKGSTVIVEEGKKPQTNEDSNVFVPNILPDVFLFVPSLFFNVCITCSCITGLPLKCFYRHVLSRMRHYEYAAVSILLASWDYRHEARVMHMRETRTFQTYPNFSCIANRPSCRK